MTLTLNTAIQFLHKTLWQMIMYYQTKFCSKRISNLEDTVQNSHILTIRALAVTLTLKIANAFFCRTLQLIMMHHNTEFDNKMFGGLENIIWINIDVLTLRCDLDLEGNNSLFFHKTLWPMITYHRTKFRCQRISSSEDTVVRVMF